MGIHIHPSAFRQWRLPLIGGAFLATIAQAAPVPEWLYPDFNRRLVLQPAMAVDPTLPGRSRPPTPRFLLVEVPAPSESPNRTFAVANAARTLIPFRLLHVGPASSALLIQLTTNPSQPELSIYFSPGTNAPATAAAAAGPDTSLRDPTPVAVNTFSGPGESAPDTWGRLLALYANAGSPSRAPLCSGVDRIIIQRRDDEHHRRHRMLAEVQTILLCPTGGVYRFSIGNVNAGGLLVDNELAVHRFDAYDDAPWSEGFPIHLPPGPHRLRLLAWIHERVPIRIGWQPPGAASFAVIPPTALVTAYAADASRTERIDRTFHADLSVQLESPYGFYGSDHTFIPARLRNTSRNWLQPISSTSWTVDGQPVPLPPDLKSGDALRVVLTGASRHPVELTARDALGFVASRRQTIDTTSAWPRLREFNAVLHLRPSACYPGDELHPHITVDGIMPSDMNFLVRCHTTRTSGAVSELQQSVVFSNGAVSVSVPPFIAGDTATLDWSVEHAGVPIRRETIRFVMPPAAPWPARIEADRLYAATGERLVLVAADSPRARQQPAIPTARAFGRITCVDDHLLTGAPYQVRPEEGFDHQLAHLVDGPDHPVVRLACLPDWDATPAHGPALKFIQVPEAIGPDCDVAILSIGLRDLLRIRNAAAFEREIAALTDHVSASLDVATLWVTPPPFPAQADAIRPFALAIRRMASARGIPVADLFTAFQTAPGSEAGWFIRDELALTKEGQQRAARIIARALLLPPT